jgi:hypothetical protein
MGPGDVVDDRFEIERLAASGGMGEVFRARDRLTGDTVAVKVLLGGQATDIERFRRETQVLARLSHPGIVRYVAHGALPSGAPYLVMEWLEGHDLENRLQRGRLTVEESLTVAAQVATALQAAHELGVVHRDIKPKNLLLVGGRLDRVKLIDFGIARAQGTVQMTQAGMLMGTPGYMAPEQCTSEQALDARADVYALGCMLFECLTGVPAFKGQHAMAVLVKVLFEATPRVRDYLPEAPAALDELVAQMMAKELDARPRSGTAVVAALSALGHSMVVEEEETTDKEAASTRLSRHEQRLLSVILISGPPAGHGLSAAPGEMLALPDAMDVPSGVHQDVRRFGGTLERLIDGSMIVTLTGEWIATDQATLAARCALALGRHYPERWIALATGYREASRRTSRSPVREAPPMSSSDAIARAIGLLGPALPPPGTDGPSSILIDEVTAGLLDARFAVRESLVGYLLADMHTLPERPRALLGRPTACVGRERELGLLDQAFTACAEESLAQAVLVTAPAGLGKSRLVQEFLSRLAKRGAEVSVWRGRGDPLAADTPLGLLGDAIRGACGLREEDPLAVRRERLMAKLGQGKAETLSAGARHELDELVDELVGMPAPVDNNTQRRSARRDALLGNEPMQALWLDVLRAECAAQPLLLVLEDLHWGDLPTVHFIDVALRELRDRPWMVIGLGRPEMYERFRQLWNGPSVQVLPLQPLGRRAGERLVRQLLGENVDPDTMNLLVERSDGNPFYLEELLRTAARRPGQALPETVIAMVQSRLAVLGEEVRRMLRAASVFGEVFWMGGVARLLGSEDQMPWVREMLGSLVEQELLVRRAESRLPGEEEYAFRHTLLREGAYAMLVKSDRALGHRLAGAWLQEHGETDPTMLAAHLDRRTE